MSFVGQEVKTFEYTIYIIVTIIAGLSCCFQLVFLQKMNILPAYVLPLLSFCICYENIILILGDDIGTDSLTAKFGYIFHSFQIPMLLASLFETAFRLHETRSAHFFCLPFDQGPDMPPVIASLCLWAMRAVCAGLFIINIIVDFGHLPHSDHFYEGKCGYIYLSKHKHSLPAWLSLIPPIVLSLFGLLISIVTTRYGNNLTIGLKSKFRWRFLVPCVLAQAIGQIFDCKLYPVSSNLGEVILLIGLTYLLYLTQEDLLLAGSFADYLHSSNVAFKHIKQSSNAEEEKSPSPMSPRDEKVDKVEKFKRENEEHEQTGTEMIEVQI